MRSEADRDQLHDSLDAIDVSDWTKMVVHALIDTGHVTVLECGYEECRFPTRSFPRWTRGRRQLRGMRMVIDHVVPRSAGGGNRPANLHLVHESCNTHKANHSDRQQLAEYRAQERTELEALYTDDGDIEETYLRVPVEIAAMVDIVELKDWPGRPEQP